MRSKWTTFLSVSASQSLGHMSATSLRLAVRINGHVQPTCAVKVDTLLTEEKARAKLINKPNSNLES